MLYTVTPKLFTVVVTGTVVSATLTVRIFSSDLSLVPVPITTASVLSGLRQSRQSPFASSQ